MTQMAKTWTKHTQT